MYRWNLPETALQAYCEFAEHCREREPGLARATLEQRVCTYHADHGQVAAISDTKHPAHTQVMHDLRLLVTRILASRIARSQLPDDGQSGLDDLVQETLTIVWRKIDTFAYKSQLNTWVYAIAVRQLVHAAKSRSTQKRALDNESFSLEEYAENGAAPPEAPEHAPDALVLDDQLWQLICEVLARNPDERLLLIFQLSLAEQQTMREIGASLSLSPARIYTLLQHTFKILREDPSLRAWFGKDDGPHISA